MKALFIRCNGKLTPDMLVGGLIDMGVPPAYLRTKLEAAGVSSAFIESSNLDAKVSEDIDPFAAAILEGLSAGFIAMDGRFLVDKTAYGTASVEKIEGEVTVAEYLGYFTDREDSIFSRHLKVFGMGV